MNALGYSALGGGNKRSFETLNVGTLYAKRARIGTEPDTYLLPLGKGNFGDVMQTDIAGDAIWGSPSVVGASYEYVVYRPGGVSSANICATWPEVVAFINLGVLSVYIDSSIVSPALITSDANGHTNVLLRPYSFNAASPSVAKFNPDVRLTDFAGLDGPLQLELNSVTRSNFDCSDGAIFRVVDGANLHVTAACLSPPLTSGAGMVFDVVQGGSISTDGPVLISIGPSQQVILVTIQWIGANSTDGFIDGTGTLLIFKDGSSQNLLFPAFTGSKTIFFTNRAENITYDDGKVPPASGQANVQDICDYLKEGNFAALHLQQLGVTTFNVIPQAGNLDFQSAVSTNRLLSMQPGSPDLIVIGADAPCNVNAHGTMECKNELSVGRTNDTESALVRFKDNSGSLAGWQIGQNATTTGELNFFDEDSGLVALYVQPSGRTVILGTGLQINDNSTYYQLPFEQGNPGDVLTMDVASHNTVWAPPSPAAGLAYTNAWFEGNAIVTSWPVSTQNWILIDQGLANMTFTEQDNPANWFVGTHSVTWQGASTIRVKVTIALSHFSAAGTFTRSYSLWNGISLAPTQLGGSVVTTAVGTTRQEVSFQGMMTLNPNDLIQVRVYNFDANTTGLTVTDMSYNIVQIG